jgi:acetoin utilization deacetylase AcuC-like enzyme
MAVRVVYSEAMTAPPQGGSPSAGKPGPVVAAWLATWPALHLRPPVPATVDQLCLAHARGYVEDVLALRRSNGFGTLNAAVAASLPYTSGALLTAARWALAEGGAVSAPVSGFHHAHWSRGGGFCTFNGLMVTALALRSSTPGLEVGILDYDYHYGDGTEDILRRVGRDGITHITAGADWHRGSDASAFLAAIAGHLDALAHCDLVLYQAGADPHIDDPLGGFLTTEELQRRDELVFRGLRSRGIPVAWDLAGGYQTPLTKVVEVHVGTMRASIG